MSSLERRTEIGRIEAAHSREQTVAVLKSGCLDPTDPSTALSPEDEFTYRHHLAYGSTKDFTRLERFMLSMYGRSYLEAPELMEVFYRDVAARAQHVGQVALFANLHPQSGLSAVTIGFLGDTAAYPAHVRLNAQSANFNNSLGLSGLTRVRLEAYQRVVLDQDGQVDPLRSVLSNTLRWNPFIVEHIKLHEDLTTVVERKDMHVGTDEIQTWAEAHPAWHKFIEGTVSALRNETTNPIVDFVIPPNTEGPRNLASFERLLDFEREDNL